MSLAHLEWSVTGSTLRPIILVLRLSNSPLSLATMPSSVVHTGVKSLGCENSTAQESPIQSWKRIRPSVVSASKSGATSLICKAIADLLGPNSNVALSRTAPWRGQNLSTRMHRCGFLCVSHHATPIENAPEPPRIAPLSAAEIDQ